MKKEYVKVSEWDKIYCELLKKIINEGTKQKNRTGVDTLTIGAYTFTLNDIENNFPILQSKKVILKNALSEILWIHQAQTSDVNWLKERNNPIWNEWMIDKDGIYRIYEPKGEFEDKKIDVVDINGNKLDYKAMSTIEGKTIKKAIYYGKEWAYTIGKAYGYVNSKTKDPQKVLNLIKNDPDSRRMIINLWQSEFLPYGTLEPCVWSSEYRVIDGKLNMFVHQRSADVPAGLPFNVSQYAILLRMFAKVSNLQAGNIYYSINDAHIYENQIDQIKLQLSRYEKMLINEKFIDENKQYNDFLNKVHNHLKEDIKRLEEYTINNPNDINALKEYKDTLDNLKSYELLLNNTKPILQLSDIDDFFEFSNEVNNDKEYLKENPTGNKDIKLLNYKSMPFIKMPITQ